MINDERVDDVARRAEAIGADALEKADRLLVKTAVLRYQVNRLKDELAGVIAAKYAKTL